MLLSRRNKVVVEKVEKQKQKKTKSSTKIISKKQIKNLSKKNSIEAGVKKIKDRSEIKDVWLYLLINLVYDQKSKRISK